MLAARACGLDDEWLESARALWAAWDTTSDLWTQDLYGRLMQYIGPGTGSLETSMLYVGLLKMPFCGSVCCEH